MHKIDYNLYLKKLEDAGFTPDQTRAMLSVMLKLLGRPPLPESLNELTEERKYP